MNTALPKYDTFNSHCVPFLRVVDFQGLPLLCKELILSRYGVPHKDMSKDGSNLPGTDSLSGASATGYVHQTALHAGKHRNQGKGCRLSCGTPLQRIGIVLTNGNKQDQQQCPEKAYADYCVFRRKFGIRPLSRNQFYAMSQQLSVHHEQSAGKRLPFAHPCM